MSHAEAPAGAPAPDISVVMPVFNGARFLERSLRSVVAQTYPGWELLVVDDGSTDETPSVLRAWAAAEPRICIFRLDPNRGPSAARNHALRQARGTTVAYLDCDDEYYPDYLAHARGHAARADVLVFAFDVVDAGEGTLAPGEVRTWDPGLVRAELLERNITNPLGVAHRRGLLDEAGYFDEVVYLLEDWLLWRRFARAGARFLFLQHRSGRYHVRPDSLTRTRRMPDALRALEAEVLARRAAGRGAGGAARADDFWAALGAAADYGAAADLAPVGREER